MEENINQGEQVLRKEIYKVKCPKKIIVGDPLYFEEYTGEKLKKLTACYKPPDFFEARIVLSEVEMDIMPETPICSMDVYLAPKETICTYTDGMMYAGQEIKSKEIGVDTARYLICVDDRSDTIYTGGDGYWGACEEYRSKVENKYYIDAIVIRMSMPENESFHDVKQRIEYFFEDVQPIKDKAERKKEEQRKTPER